MKKVEADTVLLLFATLSKYYLQVTGIIFIYNSMPLLFLKSSYYFIPSNMKLP